MTLQYLFNKRDGSGPGAKKGLLGVMSDEIMEGITSIFLINWVQVRCSVGDHRFRILANNEFDKMWELKTILPILYLCIWRFKLGKTLVK